MSNEAGDLWWLSFCEPGGDGGFIGACVVRATGVKHAVQESHRLGCNPGGEVMLANLSAAMSGDIRGELEVLERHQGRLLSLEEIQNLVEVVPVS